MTPKNLWQRLAVLVLLLGLTLAPVQSTEAEGDDWIHSGPQGGWMAAIAVDPTDATIVYAATVNGRVTKTGLYGEYATEDGSLYKSIDGGATWRPANHGLNLQKVKSIVVNPQAHTTLYAAGMPGNIYKSINGGESWTKPSAVALADNVNVVAIDPQTPTTLYAGTTTAGVFKSVNGGESWTQAGPTGQPNQVRSLILDPTNMAVLYVGTGAGGVFKSSDGGASWNAANAGLPDAAAVNALALEPSQPSSIYAAVGNVIYRSSDGGQQWTQVNAAMLAGTLPYPPPYPYPYPEPDAQNRAPASQEGLDVTALAIDPNRPGFVYAGTSAGVYGTQTGGDPWSQLSDGLDAGDVALLALAPTNTDVIFAGVRGVLGAAGIYKSVDAGAQWSVSNTGLINHSIALLALDSGDASRVYAAGDGAFFSEDRGQTWSQFDLPTITVQDETISTSGVQIAAVPGGSPALYLFGALESGLLRSTDGGESWVSSGSGLDGNHVQTLIYNPRQPQTLYAGLENGIYRSLDGGENWAAISNGLPGAAYKVLVASPSTLGTLYAAGNFPGVYQTIDNGAHWRFVGGGLGSAKIQAMAVDPESPQVVFAAAGNDGLYKSVDGGGRWTRANQAGAGLSQSVYAVLIDPDDHRRIFAGASDGVYRSVDQGATWRPVAPHLAGVTVTSLALDRSTTPERLHAGTLYHGVYSLDLHVSAPILSGLEPNLYYCDGSQVTLTLTGENFLPTTQVYWDRSERLQSQYVSERLLTVTFTRNAQDCSYKKAAIEAFNPGAGGGYSNARWFTIDARPPGAVQPLLSCVEQRGEGLYRAHFSYINRSNQAVSAPYGARNYVEPANGYSGQPVLFTPGSSPLWPNAPFKLDFDGTMHTWFVDGATASASSASPRCPQMPAAFQITRVSPAQGRLGLPNELYIQGRGFRSGSTVYLHSFCPVSGGVPSGARALVTAWGNDNSLRARVLASMSQGEYAVIVANPGGAIACLAQGYRVLPAAGLDFSASEHDFWTLPVTVHAGASVQLGLTLHRSGGDELPIDDLGVHFYLGEKESGGRFIGDVRLDGIERNAAGNVSITWQVPPAAGVYTIYAYIDPEQAFPEEVNKNNNIVRWVVKVRAAGVDVTPPTAISLTARVTGFVATPTLPLTLEAQDETGGSGLFAFYVVEYEFNQANFAWIPVRTSDWMPMEQNRSTFYWTLSNTPGLHYLKGWAVDRAGNISTEPASLSLNYQPGAGQLAAGEARLFRQSMAPGDNLRLRLTSIRGDADLYLWPPDESQPIFSVSTGTVDEINFTAGDAGVYQIEVYGYTDAEYRLEIQYTPAGGGNPYPYPGPSPYPYPGLSQTSGASRLIDSLLSHMTSWIDNKTPRSEPLTSIYLAPSDKFAIPGEVNVAYQVYLPMTVRR